MTDWILLGISLLIIAWGFLWRWRIVKGASMRASKPTQAAETAQAVEAVSDSDTVQVAEAEQAEQEEQARQEEQAEQLVLVAQADRSGLAEQVAQVGQTEQGGKVPDVTKAVKQKPARTDKKTRRLTILATMIGVIGIYILLTRLIAIIFGPGERSEIKFSLWPERVDIFGISLSVSIVYTWVAMLLLIIGALLLRLAVVRKFTTRPAGAQNGLETVVEIVGKYTSAQAHGTGEFLCSYILTIGSLMLASAFLELFRLRPPTADITMTFSLAFMTFIFINVYGVRRKGSLGRIKALASPTPVVFIFRVIAEFAIPVSMACRLFGNMLGGMIVIDLLYMALGSSAVGIPSVAGLYFNVFHPMMQTFIFVTLTLTFINEAIE